MSVPGLCSSCGLSLDASSRGGLCPACLLKLGIAAGDAATALGPPSRGASGPGSGAAADTPRAIGPYRLVRTLGEGGMGVVYLAEQDEPIRRTVALKLIKLGMDTHEVVARFDAERQALALMDHSNIASVLDAGAAPDGRPYFVMEYAPGVPLTDYCDAKRLGTRERLRIFIEVCAAIQHAHQKGIIHRDLKPSNVLVIEEDGRPIPKVIDFGIAKATDQRLTERTLFTQHGLLVGTPEYMSPEQAELGAVDLDTRTDIYSLGVMLYELLVGSLPFSPTRLREAGYTELIRIIREEEPMRPSTRLTTAGGTATRHGDAAARHGGTATRHGDATARHGDATAPTGTAGATSAIEVAARRRTKVLTLANELRGDLDWITLKALEKDRARRYASVSEFAADLTRYLADEPVSARPPSMSYRAQKFVRRNRLAVTAASLVALAVVSGLVTSSVLYVRAERARRDAVAQRAEAVHQRTEADVARRDASDRATAESHARADADQQRTVADGRRIQAESAQSEAERQRTQAEQQGYRAAIAAADLLLRSNQVDEARTRLASAPAALRNWEWKYLYAQTDTSLTRMGSGGGAPTSIAFTPDGSRLLWVSDRGILRSATRVDHQPIPGFHRPTRTSDRPESVVAVSADGSKYVTAAWMIPVVVSVYLRVTGTPEGHVPTKDDLQNARGFAAARSVRGYPPGKGGLSDPPVPPEDLRTLSVKDASSGATLARLPLATIGVSPPILPSIRIRDSRLPGDNTGDVTFKLAGSPDGYRIVDSSDRTLATMSGRPETVVSAAFSADGRKAAAWSWDNVITVWDTATGTLLATLSGHEDGITQVAFNPSGSQIASASHDATVRVWDLSSGSAPRILKGHEGAVMSIAFSADGTRVASGGADKTVRIWDAAGSSPVTLRGHADKVTAVAYSPNGKLLVSGSGDKTIRVWDLGVMQPVGEFKGHAAGISSLSFSPDGRQLASGSADDSVRIWDMRGVRFFPADPVVVSGQNAAVHDMNADLRRVVTASAEGGALQWWSLDRPEGFSTLGYTPLGLGPSKATGNPDRIMSLALTPDGRKAATGKIDGTVRVWTLDGTVPPLALAGPPWPAVAVAIRPGGIGGAASFLDHSLRVWDSASGWVATLVTSESDMIYPLQFSPDGKRLAAAAGRAIKLWSLSTRAVVLQTTPLPYRVSSMAFSPDGGRIAAADLAGNIRIWNTRSGEVVTTIPEDGRGGGSFLAFDPTGTRLVSTVGYGNERLQVWDVNSSHSLLQLDLQGRFADRLAFAGGGAWLSVLSRDSSVGIFDTRSSYPLDADQFVGRLFRETRLSSEVLERVHRDRSLGATLRNSAEQMARAEGDNCESLIAEAKLLASLLGRSPEEYHRAVRYAAVAVEQAPTSVGAADALGLALYRVGRYRDSVASFRRGISLRGGLEFLEGVFMTTALIRLDDDGAQAAAEQLDAFVKGLAGVYPVGGTEAGWYAELQAVAEAHNSKPAAVKKK